MDIFREQQFACFSRESIVTSWSYENSPVQPTVYFELSNNLFIYLFTNTVYMKIIYNNNSTLDRPESGLLGIPNISLRVDCMVNMKINVYSTKPH